MGKYLKKITASARFYTQILTKEEFKKENDDVKESLWRIYLEGLRKTKQISRHQANTWKYPDKIL